MRRWLLLALALLPPSVACWLGRQNKTVWHTKITDSSEDATTGIEAWLTGFGWDVEVIDLRTT